MLKMLEKQASKSLKHPYHLSTYAFFKRALVKVAISAIRKPVLALHEANVQSSAAMTGF